MVILDGFIHCYLKLAMVNIEFQEGGNASIMGKKIGAQASPHSNGCLTSMLSDFDKHLCGLGLLYAEFYKVCMFFFLPAGRGESSCKL
jgi:hypothetical protein